MPGLNQHELTRVDHVISIRRKVNRGTALFRDGESFAGLYAIRSGFFKACVQGKHGREQVTGFHMAGDVIGLDGIVNQHHAGEAVALEDAEACILPFERVAQLSREVPALQQLIHKMLSREIVRKREVIVLLGGMRVEQRLASFLWDMVQRLHRRGFSSSELVLRMTREEIGSNIGVQIETVCRTFTRLAEESIVEVNQRHVRILDTEALKDMARSRVYAAAN